MTTTITALPGCLFRSGSVIAAAAGRDCSFADVERPANAVHTLHTLDLSSQVRGTASDNRSAATTVQPLRASGWPA